MKGVHFSGAAAGAGLASRGPPPAGDVPLSPALGDPLSPSRTIKNSGLRSIQPRAFAKNPHLRYM